MTIFENVPTSGVVLLSLLVTGVLIAQNLGWLLWAKALRDGRSRPFGAARETPTAESEERAKSLKR